RFDAQIIDVSERLKRAGKDHSEVAEIPIWQPDAIPKKTWRKKEAHGKATARALTSAELAERDLKATERRNKKQRQRVTEAEEEEIIVLATPGNQPPASTGPPRLSSKDDGEGEGEGGGDGRAKRKRKATEAYRNARLAGLQSLGYSQVE